jgi:hypothetical protein
MKLVMTLVVRDEVDVIDAWISYHLNAGVDLVVATDHRSADGTTEVLEGYERQGLVRLVREEGELLRQATWQTRMAHLAATEHGADWVLASDADEFWWPLRTTLKDSFAAIPEGIDVVYAFSHSFLPRAGNDWFPERLTVRLRPFASIHDPAATYRPVAKVAFRANAKAIVGWGNHRVGGFPQHPLYGWSPLQLLHFPVRSREQIARKYWNKAHVWEKVNLRGDVARARTAFEAGEPEVMYERLLVDETTVARGLAEGVLVEDTRLRDALRKLATRDVGSSFPGDDHAVRTPSALDFNVLGEADLVRMQRSLDELGERVRTLENRRPIRLGSRLDLRPRRVARRARQAT